MKKKPSRIPQKDWDDVDIPELNKDWFTRARPAQEILPEILGQKNADILLHRGPGRPPMDRPKERVTIRLDADIVEWLKDQGPGYQTRINSLLRNIMERR